MLNVIVSGIAYVSYQNVMIIVMPMIPFANVAHLIDVSQRYPTALEEYSKLTALL